MRTAKKTHNIKLRENINLLVGVVRTRRSAFLLAVIVLVVIVGFSLFGHPRENGYCSFRDFKKGTL